MDGFSRRLMYAVGLVVAAVVVVAVVMVWVLATPGNMIAQRNYDSKQNRVVPPGIVLTFELVHGVTKAEYQSMRASVIALLREVEGSSGARVLSANSAQVPAVLRDRWGESPPEYFFVFDEHGEAVGLVVEWRSGGLLFSKARDWSGPLYETFCNVKLDSGVYLFARDLSKI